MRELVPIRELSTAKVLLNPIRIELVRRLREPRTCGELASELGLTPQRVGNHLKALRDAGLVTVTAQRRVRNLIEATYQAAGKAYWLSPRLLREEPTGRELADQLSLHNLLVTAEIITEDVALLLDRTADEEVPSLGLTIEISLASAADREAFAADLLTALRPVVERYSTDDGKQRFKLQIVAYPDPDAQSESNEP